VVDGVGPVEPTATGRRLQHRWVVWGVGAGVVLIVGGLVFAIVIGRRGGPVASAPGATASPRAAATAGVTSESIVRLRVTIGDARTVLEVGIPNGTTAMVNADAGAGIWLRPTLRTGGVDVSIFPDDGMKHAPGRPLVTLRVEKNGKAHLDTPFYLDVEWLGASNPNQRP
jgi:hypothetical protein